jgi:uncharacterized membrane protein
MAVEIEKTAVSFTDEAELALNRSISRLERRVRARAADLAIKSRGTPAEVTGSDIERAYRDILRPNAGEPFEEKLQSARRLRKSHTLHFISTVYVWLGLVTAIVGGLYPYIQARFANPTFRLSMAITLIGLALSGLGFFLREYTRQRELVRKEETASRFSRFISHP